MEGPERKGPVIGYLGYDYPAMIRDLTDRLLRAEAAHGANKRLRQDLNDANVEIHELMRELERERRKQRAIKAKAAFAAEIVQKAQAAEARARDE